jgi:uncharacterized protein (DUF433 family)
MAPINEALVHRKTPNGPTLVAGTEFPVSHVFSELAAGKTVADVAEENGIELKAVQNIVLEVARLAGPDKV